MTRINLVDPYLLADQHLFAEWREIKHIPAAAYRSLQSKSIQEVLKRIPKEFTLNKGHITFFMDKIDFLSIRYMELTRELEVRGYTLSEASFENFNEWIAKLPDELFRSSWQPDAKARATSVERILLRIGQKPQWYRHYGKQQTMEYYTEMLEGKK